jgi:hypothetical protein
MEESVVKRLGKHRIVQELRRGGLPVVYQGVGTSVVRTWSLKLLAPRLVWDKGFVSCFRRPARSIAGRDDHGVRDRHLAMSPN